MGHIYDRYFRFEIIFKKERRVVNIFSTILQHDYSYKSFK